MNRNNELVLLVCHSVNDADVENCHRFQCKPGLQLHLSFDPDEGVSVNTRSGGDNVALIAVQDGKWMVSPAGFSAPHLNRMPVTDSTALNCGDLLTWVESTAFVACHPSEQQTQGDKTARVRSDPEVIATWLKALQKPDSRTAELQLFQHYYPQMLDVARATLHNARLRSFDEDDVAAEALSEFYAGLAGGRFSHLSDHKDLWALLICITRRRAIDKLRKATASHRCPTQLRGESVFRFNTIEDVQTDQGVGRSDKPTDVAVIDGDEEVEHFLDFLKAYDTNMLLYQVAHLRIEKTRNSDIAARLGTSLRAVERATGKIRNLWKQHSRRNTSSCM